MKILLKENISNLGKIGEIVKVADGYGRNYLLPQGKALLPTEENIRQIEQEKTRLLAKMAEEKQEFEALAEKAGETSLTISMKASEEGSLYGSVTPQIISDQFEDEGLNISAKWIAMEEPIKELGVYEVDIKMPHEVEVKTKVWVVSESE